MLPVQKIIIYSQISVIQMKKSAYLIFGVVISGIIFFGCSGMGSQGNGLLSSSGRAGEVLVVCSDKQWKGVLGDSLHSILMQSVLGLPQDEPMFVLSHVAENYFREAYKKQRNIIYFITDTSLEQAKIVVTYDLWAQPQLLIRINAKNEQQIIETLSNYQKNIIKYLLSSEMKRFQRSQRSNQNFRLSSEVERLFNISIVIPEGFIFAVKDSNFVWLRKDIFDKNKDQIQNIMIYTEQYTDTKQFDNEHIVRLRDGFTKKYIQRTKEGSYTAVDEKYIPTVSEYVEYKAGYAVRTAGLWKTVGGDFMGGVFVNMSILDEKNNRIVTIDGFLYAPADNKRDLIRQLEAILLSVKFEQ
jgi:hypothetical protein